MKATFGLILFFISTVSLADVIPPPSVVIINGNEADQIARMMGISSIAGLTSAEGDLNVKCVQQKDESSFTCSVRPKKDDRNPASVKKK